MAKVTLGSASVEDLKKELRRRQAALPALVARRDELNRKIAELEALGTLSRAPAARRAAPARRRARNKLSLPELLAGLLKAKPGQSVNQLADAALSAGYKSKAKSFKSIVRQTLYHDKRFKRVARGKFGLKA
jgi:hypothetical protein